MAEEYADYIEEALQWLDENPNLLRTKPEFLRNFRFFLVRIWQKEPVKRRVAVKLGTDTREVVARSAARRRSLANSQDWLTPVWSEIFSAILSVSLSLPVSRT